MTEQRADVWIYTTRLCGYCFAAKRLLDSKGVSYREVSSDGRPDLRSWLREVSGQYTVPQVFVNGRSIGGFRELRRLEGDGQLDALLADPPVDNPGLPS